MQDKASSLTGKDHPFPDVLRIEPSGACNFCCVHCTTGNANVAHSPYARGLLTEHTFSLILQQLKRHDFTPRVVVLYHGGEPLLNKKITSFIKELKGLGINKIKIVTNGSLLTEEMSTKLHQVLTADDELEISFDGLSPQENDWIRRNGNFARDSKSALFFLMHPSRRCNVMISNVQILSAVELERFFAGETLKIPDYLLKAFGENVTKYSSFPAMKWPVMPNYLKTFKNIRDTSKCTYCTALFETFSILSNGNVVPCCYDIAGSTVFGNIHQSTIFDIWKSPSFVYFRENILNSKPNPICSNCKLFSKEYLILHPEGVYEKIRN